MVRFFADVTSPVTCELIKQVSTETPKLSKSGHWAVAIVTGRGCHGYSHLLRFPLIPLSSLTSRLRIKEERGIRGIYPESE
jgi:hypothetical protein